MNNEERESLREIAETINRQIAGIGLDDEMNQQRLMVHRERTTAYTKRENLFLGNMTASIATLFLNTGLCQEKASYFVAQYLLITGQQNVSFIFLGNRDKGSSPGDHVLVQMGEVVGLERLSLVREDASTLVKMDEVEVVTIEDYFKNNSDAVFADPLLQCVGNYQHGLDPLKEYCRKYDQQHVIGVRTFIGFDLGDVKESASMIIQNAKLCAMSVGIEVEAMRERIANTPGVKTVGLVAHSRSHVMETIIERYNEAKSKSPDVSKDQTIAFFHEIPEAEMKNFDSSTRRILQLGVSLGKYVGALSGGSREVIGYDISKTALAESRKRGVTVREINLEDTIPSEKGEVLAYTPQLAEDLSVPVDLLVVRCFEYLSSDAIKLLMTSVLDLMKPSSSFYFDSVSGINAELVNKHTGEVYLHGNQPGYIPSFFGARTDYSIRLFDVKTDTSDGLVVEHLIVTKR